MIKNNSFFLKTEAAIVKGIISRDDFLNDEVSTQIHEYLSLTPFYVQWTYRLGLIYCNVYSLAKQQSLVYNLSSEQVSLLLNSLENGTFTQRMILMMLKLISTLVYFDDDTHAKSIHYYHLSHCR